VLAALRCGRCQRSTSTPALFLAPLLHPRPFQIIGLEVVESLWKIFLFRIGLCYKRFFRLKETVVSINVYYHFAMANLK